MCISNKEKKSLNIILIVIKSIQDQKICDLTRNLDLINLVDLVIFLSESLNIKYIISYKIF
jgi:hypothetical protein